MYDDICSPFLKNCVPISFIWRQIDESLFKKWKQESFFEG